MKLIKSLFILFGLVFLFSCQSNNSESESEEYNQVVPHGEDLEAKELTKEDKAKLLDAKGKNVRMVSFEELDAWFEQDNDSVYIFNFWATTCAPCIKEMPYFEQLADEFEDEKMKVVFVSMDYYKHLEKKVIPFIREKQIRSEVVLLNERELTQDDYIGKISETWDGTIPATLFIQNSASVRVLHQQNFNFEELKKIISPLI